MQERTIYESSDGHRFDVLEDCKEYEQLLPKVDALRGFIGDDIPMTGFILQLETEELEALRELMCMPSNGKEMLNWYRGWRKIVDFLYGDNRTLGVHRRN